MKVTLVLASAIVCLPASMLADFSYQQSSKVTGGAMAGAMKVAGMFSKKLREPMTSSVSVKGNKLVSSSADSANIIDLDAETITEINHEKKTYATVTFAEYTAMISEAMKKMGQAPKDEPAADIKYKISMEDLKQTREIAGLTAKGYLMKMETELKDKKSGESGTMNMNVEMWVAPKVQGYDEINEFYKRMAQKLAFSPGGASLAAMGGAAMARGMVEVKKEVANMDGMPVLEIMRMVGAADPNAPAQQQSSAPPPPSMKEALSSAIPGFGGFGRKKKKEEPKEEPRQEAQGSATSGAGSLMEMTTETSGFSAGPVDASKFQIPAGYKKVEHSMARFEKK